MTEDGRRGRLPIILYDNPSYQRRQDGIRKQNVNSGPLFPLFEEILAAESEMRYTVGINRIGEGTP